MSPSKNLTTPIWNGYGFCEGLGMKFWAGRTYPLALKIARLWEKYVIHIKSFLFRSYSTPTPPSRARFSSSGPIVASKDDAALVTTSSGLQAADVSCVILALRLSLLTRSSLRVNTQLHFDCFPGSSIILHPYRPSRAPDWGVIGLSSNHVKFQIFEIFKIIFIWNFQNKFYLKFSK